MIREIDENLISPDKLMSASDMARLGCNDCRGCSDCCRDRACVITLDPTDIGMLKEGLNYSFEGLMDNGIVTLSVVDGVVLPGLASVNDPATGGDKCALLGDDGRCTIHSYRPGICRMFPLARLWHEDGTFSYFMQEGECLKGNGVKIRISKWLGYPDVKGYETSVKTYHKALSELKKKLKAGLSTEEQVSLQRSFLETWFI